MPNTDIVYVRSSILILFLSGFIRYVHFEFYIINLLGHVKVALDSQVKHALGTSMSAFLQHMASSCNIQQAFVNLPCTSLMHCKHYGDHSQV